MIFRQIVTSSTKHVFGAKVFLANRGGFESLHALSFFCSWKEEQVQTPATEQLPLVVLTVNVFDRGKPSGLKNPENLPTEVKRKGLGGETWAGRK